MTDPLSLRGKVLLWGIALGILFWLLVLRWLL